MSLEGEWDYIVVGSGAAGSVVAARLSKSEGCRVLLVEAGGSDSYLPNHIPGLGFLASSRKQQNWWFATEPSAELQNRSLVLLQGKVLGGSSTINGMMYNRAHSHEYDLWRQMGCEGWAADDVLPFFRKVEDREGQSPARERGRMPIRRPRPSLPIYEAFLDACRRNGLPVVEDLNADVADGFGYNEVNVKHGRRQSVVDAYLKPAESKDLVVLPRTLARRIVFNGRRATGVEISRDGQVSIVRARREVIVCGGAIKSPQLLLLSGIGPAESLQALGLSVVASSPRVGKNLQNHPSYRMQYACKGRSTAYTHLTMTGMAHAAVSYFLTRQGALAESIFGVCGFLRTRPELELADVQVVMCGALISKPRSATSPVWEVLPRQQGFALIVYQGSPHSRGEVRLRSSDPQDTPLIDLGYFRDPRDLDVLTAGVRTMREVCLGSKRPEYVVSEITPGPSINTDAELENDIRANIGTSFHQSGTCAMGGDPSSVLDPRLRVRGVEGLRVADASIIPVVPNAGLHGPVMMIGEKAAAMIKEDA